MARTKLEIAQYQRKWRMANRKKLNAAERTRCNALRDRALKLLGQKCAWINCEWTDVRALQFDHINGGGHQERKLHSEGWVAARILEGSKDYQILCANHNWIKRTENKEVGYGT
jgi:hypothetical protein